MQVKLLYKFLILYIIKIKYYDKLSVLLKKYKENVI